MPFNRKIKTPEFDRISKNSGQVLLLRRSHPCRNCGEIHAAPLARCALETKPDVTPATVDPELIWIF